MTALTLPAGGMFSIVTTADPRGRSPVWKALLGLPQYGDDHIDYAADTDAQRNLWAVRLDEAVLRAEKPVLLVASGASCFATAWWARLSPAAYVSRVAGALLFDPLARAHEEAVAEKFASPRMELPFPSAIVGRKARRSDVETRIAALADGWGSGMLDLAGERPWPAQGNAWQQAGALLNRATARVVERRLRVAEALGVEIV
ncbi:MAG: hypothetical protein EOP59_00540 [Sphingomonadales bacterium]|nr:MAG: hypothetical protein EOP59_00540 [Sphingomonadales bacterium]